jgi:hypothetical protein
MAINLIRRGLLRKKKKEEQVKPIVPVETEVKEAPQETKVEEEKPKGSGKREITFEDKNVKVVTPGGKEFNFTKEEYKRYNEQIGGGSKDLSTPTTPQTKEAIRIQQENQRALMLQQGQGQMPGLSQTNLNQMPGQAGQIGQINPNIPSSLYNYQEGNNGLYQGFLSMDSKKAQMLQDATELKGGQLKSGLNIAQATFGLFVDLADNLAKVATLGALGKDTLDVKNAKENLTLAKSVIERQIALVPSGQVNVYELHEAVKMYRANLSYLESTNKRIGLDNFAYWITDGRNLEQEIFNKNSEFAELERMLQLARMQNLQNSLLNQQMQLQ